MKINVNISLPNSWDELSEKQFRKVSKALVFFRKYYETMPEGQSRQKLTQKLIVTLIKHLLSQNNFLKRKIALWQIPAEEYAEETAYLFKPSQRTIFPKAFKRHGKKYIPPANRLSNISIKEFAFADAMYYRYINTYKKEYLLLLIATLYRPISEKKNIDDARIPFSKHYTQLKADYFRFLEPGKKAAILMAYEGCRNYMAKIYPQVFPKVNQDTPHSEAKQSYIPFDKLIQYKVSFDPSKLDATNSLNAHEYLHNWNSELVEIKKQKINAALSR